MATDILICGFDGTSRVPGTALGGKAFSERYFGGPAWKRHSPNLETRSSAIWLRKLRAMAERIDFRFAIGGEHSVTFPLLEAQKSRHPQLRLVVLDAHHDAYPYPLLTHATLFSHTVNELRIPTLVVGARYELERADPGCEVISGTALETHGWAAALDRIRSFVGDRPFYFSLDVDFFDPQTCPAVGAAVAGGTSIECGTGFAADLLALGPCAADIVEYNVLRDDAGLSALGRLGGLAKEYQEWLEHST